MIFSVNFDCCSRVFFKQHLLTFRNLDFFLVVANGNNNSGLCLFLRGIGNDNSSFSGLTRTRSANGFTFIEILLLLKYTKKASGGSSKKHQYWYFQVVLAQFDTENRDSTVFASI